MPEDIRANDDKESLFWNQILASVVLLLLLFFNLWRLGQQNRTRQLITLWKLLAILSLRHLRNQALAWLPFFSCGYASSQTSMGRSFGRDGSSRKHSIHHLSELCKSLSSFQIEHLFRNGIPSSLPWLPALTSSIGILESDLRNKRWRRIQNSLVVCIWQHSTEPVHTLLLNIIRCSLFER